jgi:hypothetical protein
VKLTLIERAYQLAASGFFDSMTAIRQRLKGEGYVNADIEANLGGRGTRHALMKLYGAALQGTDHPKSEPAAGDSSDELLSAEIRELVRAARDRGDIVDVNAIAAKLDLLHPSLGKDELAAMIMDEAGAAGISATWVWEPNKHTGG